MSVTETSGTAAAVLLASCLRGERQSVRALRGMVALRRTFSTKTETNFGVKTK
jgi:hypothetical protein